MDTTTVADSAAIAPNSLIELIRGRSISCELDIPAPPAGKKLDPDKVVAEELERMEDAARVSERDESDAAASA